MPYMPATISSLNIRRRAVAARAAALRRHGFSLFEVLLALAVFSVSIAALMHGVGVAQRALTKAQVTSEALARCKTQLALWQAGTAVGDAARRGQCADDPRWSWEIAEQPLDIPGVLAVTATMRFEGQQPHSLSLRTHVAQQSGASAARRPRSSVPLPRQER
jgi:prepilin-type N-terminal cleavage/methylation domain-containing protein